MNNVRVINSIKNSLIAILFKILQILLPFLARTIIIKTLGLSYVGISGLFTSIFGVLSIAELGVGSAMLHALYEPIEKKDSKKINAIINFYKKAYFIIGIVIFIVGIAIMPGVKIFIKEGTYPSDLNLYYIFLVNLSSTVVSYLIYSYKFLLLEAHQLGRKVNRVKICITIISYVIQIGILLITKNYYLYIIVLPITEIITAIWVGKVADKILPYYKPYGKLDKLDKESIFKDIKALFLYKIGGVVFNSVDSIVISWCFGAIILGVYNNYYYILSSLTTLILVVYAAILPSLGSSAIGKTKEENYQNFMKISSLDEWMNGWCSICLFCLLTPFINIWIGEKGILGEEYALMFAIYFFCWRILDPISIYKDALGLWEKDKWRPLITAVLNLTLNITLTMLIGLSGILLSSIIAVLTVSYTFSVKYLFKYFEKNLKDYILDMMKLTCFIFIIGSITKIVCNRIDFGNNILNFLLMLGVCAALPNIGYFLVFNKSAGVQMIMQKLLKQKGMNNEENNK